MVLFDSGSFILNQNNKTQRINFETEGDANIMKSEGTFHAGCVLSALLRKWCACFERSTTKIQTSVVITSTQS